VSWSEADQTFGNGVYWKTFKQLAEQMEVKMPGVYVPAACVNGNDSVGMRATFVLVPRDPSIEVTGD